MSDTPQHQNERAWTDALGLVLFAAGALAGALLVVALADDPESAPMAAGTAAMGHALLYAGGAVPVGIASFSCLILGAAQFLGFMGAQRVTRHLSGSFGVALGLCIVLGAFSEGAGGSLGMSIGGTLTELTTATVAALVGLGAICLAVWAAWLAPTSTTAWEKAQEIGRPVAPLQAKADGVTSEESAALSFEGDPSASSGPATSPYPEDVRVRGEIPEGASALATEETPNYGEAPETREEQSESGGAASDGAQASDGAEQEADALPLDTESDGEPADEDLVVSEETSELDAGDTAGPEGDLSDAEESSEDDSGADAEEGEDSEYEDEEEDAEEEYEEEEEEEEFDEEEEDAEDEEEEDEFDEEEEDAEDEDEDELEEEEEDAEDEAAELEEQGDLFDVEASDEVEVILQPQAPTEADEALIMKAADLFLERDRVAVSLLQRQFDVDFEECCVILDQLQEMGLIGPYLGGSRRDILLTRDEWLSRVGGAS